MTTMHEMSKALFRKFDRWGEDEVHARLVQGRYSEIEARTAMLWLTRKSGGSTHDLNHAARTAMLGSAKREGREKWLKGRPLLRILDRLGAWRFNKGRAVGMPRFANIRVRPMSDFDPEDKHRFPRLRSEAPAAPQTNDFGA